MIKYTVATDPPPAPLGTISTSYLVTNKPGSVFVNRKGYSIVLQQGGRAATRYRAGGIIRTGAEESRMASLSASTAAASATTVYNPYRIFQAAQRCMGEPTMVAKVLVELLGE